MLYLSSANLSSILDSPLDLESESSLTDASKQSLSRALEEFVYFNSAIMEQEASLQSLGTKTLFTYIGLTTFNPAISLDSILFTLVQSSNSHLPFMIVSLTPTLLHKSTFTAHLANLTQPALNTSLYTLSLPSCASM